MIEFVRKENTDCLIVDEAIIYNSKYVRCDVKDDRRSHKNKILNTDNKFFKICDPDDATVPKHIICPCGGESFLLTYSRNGLKGTCSQCGNEDIVYES